MEIRLFSDVIDAITKVSDIVVNLKNIPKAKRRRLQQAVSEAFKLLNSAVNLVYHRLSDAELIEDDTAFRDDVRRMKNIKEWQEIERDMRLCESLRLVHGEIDSLSMTAPDLILGSRDWQNIRRLVDQVLEREGELADYISRALSRIADKADASGSIEDIAKVRRSVKRTAKKLSDERTRLIKAEIAFLDAIA